jgi:hypothetical protein
MNMNARNVFFHAFLILFTIIIKEYNRQKIRGEED